MIESAGDEADSPDPEAVPAYTLGKISLASAASVNAARKAYDRSSYGVRSHVVYSHLLKDAELALEKCVQAGYNTGKVKGIRVSGTAAYSVSLKWNKNKKAKAGYRILRANSQHGEYIEVGTTKKLKFTDKTVRAGTTYCYRILPLVSYKGIAVAGNRSAVVHATTKTAKVTGVMAESGKVTAKASTTRYAIINWKKAPNATGYMIYRSTKKNSGFKCVATIANNAKTSYVAVNIKKGTKYYYKVRSYKTVKGKKKYGKFSALKVVCVK